MYQEQKSKSKIFLKIISSILLLFFVLLATLTILSLVGVPRQLRIFVVETGSMSPAIPAGSLIFDIPQSEYNVGDVITFPASMERTNNQASNITHRIKSINKDGTFETKGDANNTADVTPVNSETVIGKVIFHLPFLGQVIGFAKTQLGFILIVIIPSIIIVFSEVQKMKKEMMRLSKKKQNLHFNENQNE